MDRTQRVQKFRWEKILLLTSNRSFSISFHYECKQQTSVTLAVPVILSPIEITDIAIYYSHGRDSKIVFIIKVTN